MHSSFGQEIAYETISYSIRYSPSNTLHFECPKNITLPNSLIHIRNAFDVDWKNGWFRLAADKANVSNEPTLQFWQKIASHYLTSLCLLPSETDSPQVAPPS